jgi:signal transduction histidine kinase
VNAEAVPSLDLLEVIRAALDELAPLLAERTVDVETARLRVLAEPATLRAALVDLIRSAVDDRGPADAFTVRVSRTGKSVRIEIVHDGTETVLGAVRVPVAPGGSGAADA